MNPKEKALQLVSKMLLDHDMPYELAKQCALIAVEEVLRVHISIQDYIFIKTAYTITFDEYWYKVKQEIEKL